ncbi:MAG: NAD(P)H-hydrate dehydratase [Magnetococcales bacterium]|nr:NAD(P)H-hydrate dehydratase [Magnetococcales bacterium]
MKLLTSAEMRQADRRTIDELGLPGIVLMENAGAGVVRTLTEKMPNLGQRRVMVLAGGGNNGGDGFMVARSFLLAGGRSMVVLFGRGGELKGDAKTNHDIYQKLGGRIIEIAGEGDLADFRRWMAHSAVVVDAVFGTGLTRPVTGHMAQVFEMVNQWSIPVMAVDIPSGVNADNGQALGAAIKADWTVTFAAEKIGHRMHPGAALCGEVHCVPIGIPSDYIEQTNHKVSRNLPDDLALPERSSTAHKGTFGHLMAVAGSVGKSGAAVLTALGGHRVGAGLVTVASPASVQGLIAAQLIESMTYPLPDDVAGNELGVGAAEALRASGVTPTATVVGPGLGVGDGARELVATLAAFCKTPLVLDADALNVLSMARERMVELFETADAPRVLTPHPGEMARLLDRAAAAIQGDRLEYAREAANGWGVWLVLKGAGTVIAAPDGRAWINDTGNAGLAAGGSGDLLTGMIGGFLAQGAAVEMAVRAAVWLHGAAADAVAEERGAAGMVATDLLDEVQRMRNNLK